MRANSHSQVRAPATTAFFCQTRKSPNQRTKPNTQQPSCFVDTITRQIIPIRVSAYIKTFQLHARELKKKKERKKQNKTKNAHELGASPRTKRKSWWTLLNVSHRKQTFTSHIGRWSVTPVCTFRSAYNVDFGASSPSNTNTVINFGSGIKITLARRVTNFNAGNLALK